MGVGHPSYAWQDGKGLSGYPRPTRSVLRLRFEAISTGTTRRPASPMAATTLGQAGTMTSSASGRVWRNIRRPKSQRAATSRVERSIAEDISEPIPHRRQGALFGQQHAAGNAPIFNTTPFKIWQANHSLSPQGLSRRRPFVRSSAHPGDKEIQ